MLILGEEKNWTKKNNKNFFICFYVCEKYS